MNIYVNGDLHIGKQIEKVENLHEHFYSSNTPPEPENIAEEDVSAMPSVFSTEQASTLFLKARDAGWLDEQWHPVISKGKAAILAHEIAVCLHLEAIWKPFEQFWGHKNMRQNYQKMLSYPNSGEFALHVRKTLER